MAYIQEKYPEFIIIQNKENLGFSSAINQGINLSKTDYVFLLNNDVELEPDCIAKAVSSMLLEFPDTDGVIGIHQVCPDHIGYTYCPVGQCLVGKKFIERYAAVDYQLCCPDYKQKGCT